MYACVCVYMYIHIYIYIYTHIITLRFALRVAKPLRLERRLWRPCLASRFKAMPISETEFQGSVYALVAGERGSACVRRCVR